ncbi:MAG: glutamine-hydrolyzing GMP synthase, partial [bacterium]
MKMEHIVIVDFGSQYTQLIARRIRESGVYSVIVPPSKAVQSITSRTKGIVLSGGPASVYDSNAPDISPDIFKKDIPVLGICYGMQIMAYKMDGSVEKSNKREYGRAALDMKTDNPLFDSIPDNSIVWMSHSDRVTQVPSGFEIIGRSENTEAGAVYNSEKNIYGLQFHPEVVHTVHGRQMLSNFVHRICDCRASWSPESFVKKKIEEIKDRYPEGNIISGISGGVDSTVATEMVHRAAGERLKCFMIDTGLLRYREGEKTVELLREKTGLDIELIDASDRFIDALAGVTDPEKKRKIIGQVFIQEFEKEA